MSSKKHFFSKAKISYIYVYSNCKNVSFTSVFRSFDQGIKVFFLQKISFKINTNNSVCVNNVLTCQKAKHFTNVNGAITTKGQLRSEKMGYPSRNLDF